MSPFVIFGKRRERKVCQLGSSRRRRRADTRRKSQWDKLGKINRNALKSE